MVSQLNKTSIISITFNCYEGSRDNVTISFRREDKTKNPILEVLINDSKVPSVFPASKDYEVVAKITKLIFTDLDWEQSNPPEETLMILKYLNIIGT